MQEALSVILDIQERDVKMIRLLRLKAERQKELKNIDAIRKDLGGQVGAKEEEIQQIKTSERLARIEVEEADEKVKKYEEQQSAVKKVEEFNALSREIAAAERERANKERQAAELHDRIGEEEAVLDNLKETLASTTDRTQALEEEIHESIRAINGEGRELKKERDSLVSKADSETLRIYDRLFRNKQNRVVVPMENRTCSGCHIVLTAQHENLVRRADRLVFCEHCSRILYWQDVSAAAEEGADDEAPKRRRRRVKANA